MFNVNDIKNGMTILFEDNIYTVLEFSHVKPGKGAAFVQVKLKNLRTGSIVEKRFNSGVKLEKAMIEKKNMQYLYANGDSYTFMDNNTYEQLELTGAQLGDDKNYLKDGLEVIITVYQGEVLGLILPEKVELKTEKRQPAAVSCGLFLPPSGRWRDGFAPGFFAVERGLGRGNRPGPQPPLSAGRQGCLRRTPPPWSWPAG